MRHNANKTKCKYDEMQIEQNVNRENTNKTKCKWDKMQMRQNAIITKCK